jgi:hypothetical protein
MNQFTQPSSTRKVLVEAQEKQHTETTKLYQPQKAIFGEKKEKGAR